MGAHILAVDDEAKNLKLIRGFLEDHYEITTAEDGAAAWEILQRSPAQFDAILLDRMMPVMNGMELTAKVKAHPAMRTIPIVMQTAAAQREQIAEGIRAGVYYYLTKPYDEEVLLSIMAAAVRDYQDRRAMLVEVGKHKTILDMVDSCRFTFKRLDEARDLTAYLANFFPDPERVTLGLTELLVNAVEHGNLAISYEDKSRLRRDNCWEEEVSRRQTLPEYINRKVQVQYEKSGDKITLRIRDDGAGFDWQRFLELDPARAMDPNGRGIALSKMTSFDTLEYCGAGNEVCCVVKY